MMVVERKAGGSLRRSNKHFRSGSLLSHDTSRDPSNELKARYFGSVCSISTGRPNHSARPFQAGCTIACDLFVSTSNVFSYTQKGNHRHSFGPNSFSPPRRHAPNLHGLWNNYGRYSKLLDGTSTDMPSRNHGSRVNAYGKYRKEKKVIITAVPGSVIDYILVRIDGEGESGIVCKAFIHCWREPVAEAFEWSLSRYKPQS